MTAIQLFNLARKDVEILDACTPAELTDLATWTLKERTLLLARGLGCAPMVELLLDVSAAACERLPVGACIPLN